MNTSACPLPEEASIKGDQKPLPPVDGLATSDSEGAAAAPRLLCPSEAVNHRVPAALPSGVFSWFKGLRKVILWSDFILVHFRDFPLFNFIRITHLQLIFLTIITVTVLVYPGLLWVTELLQHFWLADIKQTDFFFYWLIKPSCQLELKGQRFRYSKFLLPWKLTRCLTLVWMWMAGSGFWYLQVHLFQTDEHPGNETFPESCGNEAHLEESLQGVSDLPTEAEDVHSWFRRQEVWQQVATEVKRSH